MTSLAHSSSSWTTRTKVGLTLAFLVSQMAVQAAPKVSAPPDPNDSGPVIVSTDKGKNTHKHMHKHRDVKRGSVMPDKYPTNPQPHIGTLR